MSRETDIGEPLVSDRRLARAAGRIRKEFPSLPETTWFVTYRQEATYADHEGLQIPVKPRAILMMAFPDPTRPNVEKRFAAHTHFYPEEGQPAPSWLEIEKDNRHSSDIESDVVYLAYRQLAGQAAAWLRSIAN